MSLPGEAEAGTAKIDYVWVPHKQRAWYRAVVTARDGLYITAQSAPVAGDEAITSKIVTAQSIETKLLEQQMRQARNHHRSLMTHY